MVSNEAQPDLLAVAGGRAKAKKKAKTTKTEQRVTAARKADGEKKTGTAVAVDDPAKRREVAQQQAPAPVDPLLAAIIKASADPACDPAKMRELIAIKRELDQDAAKAAFDDAFVALQAELPSIRRDGKIEVRKKDARTGERTGELQQSTPYATFNAIHEAIKPLLVKYGFGLSFSTEPVGGPDGRLQVKTTLSRKGHSISTLFPLPADTTGSKNNAQGWGSAQSYGKRYGTIALLNIVSHAPQDADTDGHEGRFVRSKDGLAEAVEVETLTEEETAELDRKMVVCKVPLRKVLDHYKIESLAELPRRLLATAIKQCDDYAENQKRVAAERDGFPGDRISTGGPRGTTRR